MLILLTKNKHYFFLLLLHALIAGLGVISRFYIIGWFYLVIITSAVWVIKPKSIDNPLSFFIAYLASMELIGRVVAASPYIPYETSKYGMFIMLLYGIIVQQFNKGFKGYLLLLLLAPAFFIDLSGDVTRRDLIFNLLGPVNVALSVIYFSGQKFSEQGWINILRLIFYAMFMVLIYVFIKTPDYDQLNFRLGSNFAVSGGFGTNQVSTVLGLGMFLCFLFYINKWALTGYRLLDLFLIFAFAFQGLLTFSRGGVLIAFIGILSLFLLQGNTALTASALRKIKYLIPATLLLLISFQVANNLTGGKLYLRYKGETEGTLAGVKEKDINAITTNRYDIFRGDAELFFQYPIWGVGAAASRYMRPNQEGIITHVELSRLLAEHGLFGILYFLIILHFGLKLYKKSNKFFYANIRFALYIIAFGTTFHAATRTFVTPLLFGLSMVDILHFNELKENEQLKKDA